jgi:AraC-like DNA-binding protein
MCVNIVEVKYYVCAGPQPGFLIPEETYNHYVLLGVEKGVFEYRVGQHFGRASFGDLVFTPPGTAFKRKSLLEEIMFHLFIFRFTENANSVIGHFPVGKVSINDGGRIASTYGYLRKAWRDYGSASIETVPVVGHMLMDLIHLSEMEQRHTMRRKKKSDPLMQQAAGHFHRQLFDDFNMQDIAAKLSITPSELTRRFRLEYGATPIEYTTRLRLEEAKRLLRETNDTMDDISSRCGFDNGSYLSRVFRSKIGISPSEFRRNHQM